MGCDGLKISCRPNVSAFADSMEMRHIAPRFANWVSNGCLDVNRLVLRARDAATTAIIPTFVGIEVSQKIGGFYPINDGRRLMDLAHTLQGVARECSIPCQ